MIELRREEEALEMEQYNMWLPLKGIEKEKIESQGVNSTKMRWIELY